MWNERVQILNIFNKHRPPNPTFCVGQLGSRFDHICVNVYA